MVVIKETARSAAEIVTRALDPLAKGAELVVLAAHRDLAVRAAVASRADAPMATLISLAHESDVRILEALVNNPASPTFVVETLASNRHRRIRDLAIARLSLSRLISA